MATDMGLAFGPIDTEIATMANGNMERERAMEFTLLEDKSTKAILLTLKRKDGGKKTSSMGITTKASTDRVCLKEEVDISGRTGQNMKDNS